MRDPIDNIIAKQLIRSSTSIGANIMEAFGSSTKKGFSNFFSIAYKSAKETMYWLYIFKKREKGNQDKINHLLSECEQINKMIASSILTIKGKR